MCKTFCDMNMQMQGYFHILALLFSSCHLYPEGLSPSLHSASRDFDRDRGMAVIIIYAI